MSNDYYAGAKIVTDEQYRKWAVWPDGRREPYLVVRLPEKPRRSRIADGVEPEDSFIRGLYESDF